MICDGQCRPEAFETVQNANLIRGTCSSMFIYQQATTVLMSFSAKGLLLHCFLVGEGAGCCVRVPSFSSLFALREVLKDDNDKGIDLASSPFLRACDGQSRPEAPVTVQNANL